MFIVFQFYSHKLNFCNVLIYSYKFHINLRNLQLRFKFFIYYSTKLILNNEIFR